MIQAPAALLAGIVIFGLAATAIGAICLLVLLWKDFKNGDIW